MGKNGDWVISVTPQLKSDMEDTARAAYENGNDLRQDALTLYESGRHSRAAALAVLAEEEYSKAFILKICAEQGRWDSNIYKALRKHPEKQGISEAMREYFSWYVDNYKRVMEMNRFAFIPVQPSSYPGDEKMTAILSTAKSRLKKPIKDFLKQDSFYVGIDGSAKILSTPSKIGKAEAKSCLDESLVFKIITEILLGDYSNIDSLEKATVKGGRII